MIAWAATKQAGAWWVAVGFLLTAAGALYELWRKNSRIAPAGSAKVALVLTIVAAVCGAAGLLGWLPAVFSWAAPAAFFIAWLEYLAGFSKRSELSNS